MTQPKVSVLLPAYNHELYLRETIDSVLQQSFSDFELLISDDCSTDGSVQVIQSYRDPRIKTALFQKNRGTVRALNHLLRMARGEYIAVIGSDDVWEPNKLQVQVAFMDSHPEIGACFSDAVIIDQHSRPMTDEDVFPIHAFQVENADRTCHLRRFLLRGNAICHASALIRSDVHQAIGEYNVAYRQLHDYDLWLRLLMHSQVYFSPEPLVRYRFFRNSGSVSGSSAVNSARSQNEAEVIALDCLRKLSDEDFVLAFAEECRRRDVSTAGQVVCEKYFLLRDVGLWGTNRQSASLQFLLTSLTEEAATHFEADYGLPLCELYQATGVSKPAYDTELYAEIEALKKDREQLTRQILDVFSSKSWRVTKPLRAVMELLNKRRK